MSGDLNVYANVGAFNLNGWMYSSVEAWAWERSEEELVDRSASPWDRQKGSGYRMAL